MRLFTALWPDACTRAGLAAVAAACHGAAWPPGARPTLPEHLHLTLHFLGEVPEASLPALTGALAGPTPCFELRLDTLQRWHDGLLVLCPSSIPAPLAALHAQQARHLRTLGLHAEPRAYAPHVTLARKAPMAGAPPPAAPVHWPVRGHALVASANGRYTVLQTWPATG